MKFFAFLGISLGILGFTLSQNSQAGEAGFLHNGTEVVTYRDGKKVGPSVAEYLQKTSARTPASEETLPPVIHFERQGGISGTTCFVPDTRSGISCTSGNGQTK